MGQSPRNCAYFASVPDSMTGSIVAVVTASIKRKGVPSAQVLLVAQATPRGRLSEVGMRQRHAPLAPRVQLVRKGLDGTALAYRIPSFEKEQQALAGRSAANGAR